MRKEGANVRERAKQIATMGGAPCLGLTRKERQAGAMMVSEPSMADAEMHADS